MITRLPVLQAAQSVAGSGAAVAPGAGAYGGQQMPDIVANLRVDQTWGSAQVMGALHEVNASYYGAGAATAPSATSLAHPSDAWGWAAGVGLKLNLPMITQGDWFQAQVNVSQGATRYVDNTPNTNWGMASGTDAGFGSEGYGVISDCVFGGSAAAPATQTSCQLTSAFGVNAGYEHFWTPALHSDVYGAYTQIKYGGSANAMLCSAEGSGNGAGVGSTRCRDGWLQQQLVDVGHWLAHTVGRDQDVLPGRGSALSEADERADVQRPDRLARPLSPVRVATTSVGNQSNWMVAVRAHRDFLP